MSKHFILDTNVILYDPQSIYSFKKNNIIIPIIVLEELDRFKSGREVVNFNAREFIRDLDSLCEKTKSDFISLGRNLGKLKVIVDNFEITNSSPIFTKPSADNQILALCLNLQKKYPKEQYTLVTKDINLRMKARALKIKTENYETGKVKDVEHLYTGHRVITNVTPEYLEELCNSPAGVGVGYVSNPVPNEFYVLKNGTQSVLARYNASTKKLERLMGETAAGINPKNVEQIFALNALLNNDIPLVTLTGRAGTGKTLMALAAAIHRKRFFSQIFLARPTVPLSNKDLGFLPGDLDSKLDPYMQPLYDNLAIIKKVYSPQEDTIAKMQDSKKIEVIALPYLRGRSLPNTFFIVDEAQNLTPHEIKTIITRVGDKTKIVFTGDIHQIDSPYLDTESNGLSYLISKMKSQKVSAHVNLIKGERSHLAELASTIL